MRNRTAVVLAAAALAMAGCAEVPTSGPVVGGELVERAEQQRPFIRVEAPPPRGDAEPVAIVDGFIEAMATYSPGYETAKLFLTQDAAASWDPAAGLIVYGGARPNVNAVDADTVRVTMTVSGTVDAEGAYAPAAPGMSKEIELRLERENDQWRIANPPDGIVIAEFSFSREYQARNAYFFTPDFNVLVPDPVYVPRSESAATLLAQRLLDGPSEWLAPAVRTAFPGDVELDVNAVAVESGVARVELSDEAGQASPEDRELMTAQLAWTLGELPEVQRVAVTSDGIPLPQGRAEVSRADADLAAYDPGAAASSTLAAVGESGLVLLGGGDTEPAPGPLGRLDGVREVALNHGGDRAAVVTAGGTQLQLAALADDDNVATVVRGGDLRSPGWDRTGLIWVVDQDAPGHGVIVTRSDGQRSRVAVPGLAGRDVERLAVSLDGARVAFVADGQAYVGDVVRDQPRSAISLERLRPVGPEGEAVDVSWQTSASVVVLLAVADQPPLPYVVGLSGQVTTPRGPAVTDAVGVTAAPPRRIVVETSRGILLEQTSGSRWSEIGAGRSPAYPG